MIPTNYEYELMRAAAGQLVRDIYDSVTDWGNNDASAEYRLVDEWPVPQDDRILSVLAEIFRSPPEEAEEGSMQRNVWESVVSDLLAKAVRGNDGRVGMLRGMLSTPSSRHLAVITLWHIHGDAKAELLSDAIEYAPEMSEEELDFLIEELLSDERLTSVLRRTPGGYRPQAVYLLGRLPTAREMNVRAPRNWKSRFGKEGY